VGRLIKKGEKKARKRVLKDTRGEETKARKEDCEGGMIGGN